MYVCACVGMCISHVNCINAFSFQCVCACMCCTSNDSTGKEKEKAKMNCQKKSSKEVKRSRKHAATDCQWLQCKCDQ